MKKEILSIQKCADYTEEQVKLALEALLLPFGSITNLVKPNDLVLIKPNMLSCKDPDKAATTHPALLKQLALICIKAGAKVVIGDSPPAIFGRAQQYWQKTGFEAAAQESGAQLFSFESDNKRLMSFVSNKRKAEVPIIEIFFKADVVINFCKMKTHNLTKITGATKNLFGLIPGLQKAQWHKIFPAADTFGNFITDLASNLPCKLHIMDGVVAMDGAGPAGGDPYKMSLLLASTSPVALDMAFCKVIGIEPDSVQTISHAKKIGWGPKSLDEVDYQGPDFDEIKVKDFRVPNISKITNYIPWKIFDPFKKLFVSVPHLKEDRCIACGRCKQICPAKAITIDSRANFDYKKCISCFCCMEVCPLDIIEAKSTPLLSIALKLRRLKRRKKGKKS